MSQITGKTLEEVKGMYPDALLLDIREPKEFADGKTATVFENRPMGQVFVDSADDKLPKHTPIKVLCRSGGRANITARELKDEYDIESIGGVKDLA